MFLKKIFSSVVLIVLTNLFLRSTVIDVEVMQLGQDKIILYKDQHRFDDSQEIWQAAAMLVVATDISKPVDLILIEQNALLDVWNSLPDDSNLSEVGKSVPEICKQWQSRLVSIFARKKSKN